MDAQELMVQHPLSVHLVVGGMSHDVTGHDPVSGKVIEKFIGRGRDLRQRNARQKKD
jgi:hypothetical protein